MAKLEYYESSECLQAIPALHNPDPLRYRPRPLARAFATSESTITRTVSESQGGRPYTPVQSTSARPCDLKEFLKTEAALSVLARKPRGHSK
jgi:hypothetical protein